MSARTQVGIVEWARRIEQARVTERWLADTLSAGMAEAPDAAAKAALVRRARLHAWHAELWKSVVPLLHNSSFDAVVAPGIRAGTNSESVLERLDEDYGARRGEPGRGSADHPGPPARHAGPRGGSGGLTCGFAFPQPLWRLLTGPVSLQASSGAAAVQCRLGPVPLL